MASQRAPEGGSDPSADRRRHRRWPRWLPAPKVLLALGLAAGLVVVVVRARGDFVTAFHHLTLGRLPWLAAALGAEGASFLCYSEVQRRLLLAGGAKLGHRTVFNLAVAATGLTNLVPGGTAPASGWLVGQYRRHGIPMPVALWAVLAGGFAAAISVLTLLAVGAGVAGLIGIASTVGCLAALGAFSVSSVAVVHHLPTVDRWLQRHCGVPGVPLLQRLVAKLSEVVGFRATVPGGAQVFALSIGNWGLDVVTLISAFALMGLPVPWRAVLFAYATAQVAGSLAPVPGGIGFVEGGMIGAFALTGTGPGAAVVATLVYRVITSLAVAGVGSLMILVVTHRQPATAELHEPASTLDRRQPDPDDPAADDRTADGHRDPEPEPEEEPTGRR
ncbi:MAG: lysylphosphatidylglycerol synthase transmembrane domain-containing protein [Acidimicrobiales bacterium]